MFFFCFTPARSAPGRIVGTTTTTISFSFAAVRSSADDNTRVTTMTTTTTAFARASTDRSARVDCAYIIASATAAGDFPPSPSPASRNREGAARRTSLRHWIYYYCSRFALRRSHDVIAVARDSVAWISQVARRGRGQAENSFFFLSNLFFFFLINNENNRSRPPGRGVLSRGDCPPHLTCPWGAYHKCTYTCISVESIIIITCIITPLFLKLGVATILLEGAWDVNFFFFNFKNVWNCTW